VSLKQFITLPHSQLKKHSPHIPKLTYFMEQSPSLETNRFSATQEIPHNLWNLKIQYRIYKSPLTVPILSQLYPVHNPTSHFLKIHLNIILQPMPGSPKWSLSLRFPQQNPVYALLLPPFALHVPPIAFFLILSPAKHCMSTESLRLYYVVFFTPFLPCPS